MDGQHQNDNDFFLLFQDERTHFIVVLALEMHKN